MPLPAADAILLGNLSPSNPELVRLRQEIADNLRSTARDGTLRHPLRFVRYRVQKGEHFFSIMARVSQNADTLASLNRLPGPAALEAGDELLIPNARGVFTSGKTEKLYSNFQPRSSSSAIAAIYALNPGRLALLDGSTQFHPGMRFEQKRLDYFSGKAFAMPLLTGAISSGYGMRKSPFSRKATFHGGIDIAAPSGTPVHASRAGKVTFSGIARGYGNLVIVEHDYGYETYYGHLSRLLVRTGETVEQGSKLGLVGSTGLSTGPHLHFEVRHHGVKRPPRFEHAALPLSVADRSKEN